MVTNFGCTGLLIVFIAAFPLEAEQSCQNSTKRKEPHCDDILSIGKDAFQIFADISLQGGWQEAQTYCECVYKEFDIVGHLAVLSDNSVFEEVRGHLMNDSIYTSADCVRGYWIGCMNRKDSFTWINGKRLATDDPVWFPGQPNDIAKCAPQISYQNSQCPSVCCQMWINIFNDSNLKIDDTKCDHKNKFFICQFPNGAQIDHFQNCSEEERQPHKPKLCPTDITSDDKGIIHWPDTDVRTTREIKCPYSKNSTSKAKRECKCKVRSPRAEWDPPVTSACTPHSQVNRGERLNHLANTTIPPGQAKKVAEQLANITSEADDFEENDVTLSVDVIDNILESGVNGTEIEVAEDVLMSVDNLLQVDHGVLVASQQNENIASRLIESVEKLSLIVQFINESMNSGNQSVTIETENIALILAEINSELFVGLNFWFSSGKTELSRRTGPDDVIEETESSIHLPISLLDGLEPDERSQVNRVQFVIHKLNTFFKAVDMNGTQAQFSPVIAASIGELRITNLRDPVRIQIPRNNQVVNSTLYNVSCAFWDYSLSDGAGAWSEEGCEVASDGTDGEGTESNLTVCECNHLTNFALLVNIYSNDIDETHQKSLSIISYIGCGISLIASAITLVSVIVYRKKKNKATKILISLCSALSMALLMFLIGALFVDLGPRIPGICATIAVLQHYFLLAVLLWMALEATYLYLKLVKVFEKYIKNFMVKFCLIGWGVPLITVIVVLAVDVKNYGYMYNDRICWLSQYAFYGAFLVPFGVVLIFNSVIFCLVIHQICGLNSRAITKSERFSIQAQLKAAIGLMALLGLTWTFAIFAISEASLVFMYLFAIFNCLQGLFIFVFHCALKTDIQDGWKRTFCGQEKAPYQSKESNGTSSAGIRSVAHKYLDKDTESKNILKSDSTTTI
ncbi:adhesion G-protein coupled receptor G6-like [Ptychodera flava]|uniref:adhesion G-protein coupled receptor G6-like n=1 Tax=Ptychodera flava TaxID=63121 RepID=UPI00396A99CC